MMLAYPFSGPFELQDLGLLEQGLVQGFLGVVSGRRVHPAVVAEAHQAQGPGKIHSNGHFCHPNEEK